MNNNNIHSVFQFIRLNELDNVENEINSVNVNQFINSFGENLLQEAIAFEAIGIVKFLLNCQIDINHSDQNGKTPLHFSAAHNDFESTKLLLNNKLIEINKNDKYGNNPLWVAVFNARGYYDIVKLLKEFGADPNSKNNNNKSPLDFAKQIGDDEMIKILTS
ncbi:ankyrin repeat domain-containing protein [Chryseobacterium sp. ES2]|uniref:Ankyrin repeat domain-containing protein n=1 Tax=Chryseobacterium metallicongregator TaxID=3073042 RepID=A0ABU1E377_9FLAO|nr:ankyrin repeat domain-containing protein [Chryseobacterium sp. ES2]MDR4952239.1 ankyrin repeat domain-containing protein [Chryseobacterium sp. ES2]